MVQGTWDAVCPREPTTPPTRNTAEDKNVLVRHINPTGHIVIRVRCDGVMTNHAQEARPTDSVSHHIISYAIKQSTELLTPKPAAKTGQNWP